MKSIRVKISNYNPCDQFSYGVFILKILEKKYSVTIDESEPEYVFFNESSYSHLKYPEAIKIFYTGENVHPNFNFCDYAIGFDYMEFGDRYHRFPVYMVSQFYSKEELELTNNTHFSEAVNFTSNDLSKKTDFASFVYSNYLGENSREFFFKKLNTYKKVSSGGSYLNNVGGKVKNKLEFESKHKFSIAFENSSNIGYTTEKLPNAISAKTIPIYWGNPEIGREFNTNRFINCMKYRNFEEVIDEIKKIDSDDDLYLSMINQPVVASYDFSLAYIKLEKFINHIIDQSISDAKRIRINPAKEADLIRNDKLVCKIVTVKTILKKILAKIYKPFRNKLFEKLKYSYFRKKILK